MTLNQILYFQTIAQCQHFRLAASELNISQPSLSRSIANLEEELGKQLFIRGTKGSRKVTLTEEGMILRKRAEEIMDLVRKAENEIKMTDDVIVGDVYIGTGETDGVRLIARAAGLLQEQHPGIHYHISSGNASFVFEYLDKGLIDFGIVFGNVDLTRYNALELPCRDTWGVLMRRDSPLAAKSSISPQDLYDVPLILSQQESQGGSLTHWIGQEVSDLNIIATYNLLYNASLLVDEGLGYAIGYDKIINTSGNSRLCFRPLKPRLGNKMSIIWKKYQIFSKPAEKFLEVLRESLSQPKSTDES